MGVPYGKRNAVLCMLGAFATCAIILSIPTTKAFTGGVKHNMFHLTTIFPLHAIAAMCLAFMGTSVFFNLGGICEELSQKEALILRVKVYLISVGSWFLCQMVRF